MNNYDPSFGLFVGVGYILMLGFALWLAALLDILKSTFKVSNNKIVWLIVSFVLPVLGPILYFLIGRNQIKKGSGISMGTYFTVVMFFVYYPVAIVSMWPWTKWSKSLKIAITIVGIALMLFGLWGKYYSTYR